MLSYHMLLLIRVPSYNYRLKYYPAMLIQVLYYYYRSHNLSEYQPTTSGLNGILLLLQVQVLSCVIQILFYCDLSKHKITTIHPNTMMIQILSTEADPIVMSRLIPG